MATYNLAYDHPAYNVRWSAGELEVGGTANTLYGKFVAFTTLQAYTAMVTPTVLGTNTSARMACVDIIQVSGTTTTTVISGTFGTQAVFVGTSQQKLALSGSAGGLALAQGDVLLCQNGTDAAFKASVTFEVGLTKGANLTS